MDTGDLLGTARAALGLTAVVYLISGCAFVLLVYMASKQSYTEVTIEKTDLSGQDGYDSCVALGNTAIGPYISAITGVLSPGATTYTDYMLGNNFESAPASHFKDSCKISADGLRAASAHDFSTRECELRDCFVLGLSSNPSTAVPWDTTSECVADVPGLCSALQNATAQNDHVVRPSCNETATCGTQGILPGLPPPCCDMGQTHGACPYCPNDANGNSQTCLFAPGATYWPAYLAGPLNATLPGNMSLLPIFLISVGQ